MKSIEGIYEVDIKASVKLSSPHSFALLVSKKDDIVNVMAVSWFMFVSLNPGKMCFAVSNKSYTSELIEEGSSVSVCLPVEGIKKEAFACGTQTGRGIKKASKVGLDLSYVEDFSAPIVVDASVCWLLKVSRTVTAGDHMLYIADIEKVVKHIDKPHLYAFDGYKKLACISKT